MNRHQDMLWYNKAAFDPLLGLLLLTAIVDLASQPEQDLTAVAAAIRSDYAIVRALRQAQAESGYRVEYLLAAARGDTPIRPTP